jgi:hypothetical protein
MWMASKTSEINSNPETLSVLTYNIWFGNKMDERKGTVDVTLYSLSSLRLFCGCYLIFEFAELV